MQKLLFVFVMLLGAFGFSSVEAQIAPTNSGIFFQAVARDNYSNPAKDRTVYVEASIIQNAANGTKVLTELFQTTTDGLGVFSISIGSGTRIGGTLSGLDKVDWAKGPYYLGLKIAIKPLSPVTNWDYTKELIDLGASAFGTVPYAFYAANSSGSVDQLKASDTTKMLLPYVKKTDLALKVNLADSSTIYVTPTQLRAVKFDTTSIYAVLNQKEIVANKSTSVTTDATSDVKYPSVRAVKSYVDLQFSNFVLADGSVTTSKIANGAVTDAKIVSVAGSKVTGDIAGNAATATLATNASLAANATKLATPRTINGVAFDGSSNITIATGSNPIDADATTKGIVQLTGDLSGTATQPRIANGAVTNDKIADVAASKITGAVAIANGGTGATTAAGARTNLGLVIGTDVLAQRTFGSAANNSTTDFIAATEKGANNGVATLGNNGKIPSTQIPAISFQSASVIASQAAMLALANQQVGSIAIRTDNNKNYVLSSLPATTLANWIELATPSSVTSVNGNAGPNVVLTAADIAGVEIASNKSNDISADAASTTKFPTVKSIKDYVDQQSANAGVADNSITSAKINGTIAIAKGGTGATTAAGARTNLGLVIGTDVMSATATTTLTGDVTGSGNGSFATTVNSVGGVSSSTIATLPTSVNANTASITAEITRATNAEAALDSRITSNTASITTNANNISSLTTSLNANTASITAEITRATNAEAALDTRITSNTASITANTNNISSLTTSVNANTASITAEVTRATNAETALDTRVASNTVSITANTNNISSLTTSVNANTASITAEVTRATNAEVALDTRVTSNTASITSNTADILLKAPLNSPTFTGTPTAPTPATSDNSTKVATTEYVKNSITAASAGLSTIGAISGTSNANGATISGTTELILTPADVTNGGVVTTGAQTFAGAKTFTNTVTFGKDITVSGLTVGGSTTYGNTALGYIALNNVQAGSYNAGSWNTAVGHASMYDNTTGNFNTAIGRSALTKNTTGSYNTTVGFHSGSSLRTVSTSFPTENTFIGNSSGAGITTGSYNTILGSQTYSIVSGAQVGIGITTGSNNTIIGGRIFGLAPTLSNNVILADGAGNIRAQHDGTTGWTLGTIASGTWSGTTISAAKGGTGLTSPGASGNILTSDGTNWVSSAPAVSGVSTLAYSTTGSSNGGTISGTTLTLTAADASNPGLISTGTQSIAGAKTFSNDITATNFLGNATTATTAGNITATSNTTLTSLSNLNTVGTITTGTWSGTTIAVANGGTGRTSITDGQILFGNGTSALGTNSNLIWNNTDGSFGIGTSSPGSGFNTKLDVVGNSSFRMNGINRALKFDGYSPSGSLEVSRIYTDATSGTPADFVLGTYPNGHLNQLYLKQSNGFVGIRNSSPASALDVNGTVTATDFSGTLTGNASSATALATGRTISTTGDVTFTSGAFDGTSNVTGSATLTNTTVTAGTYGSSTAIPTFTVDSKGRLTAANTVGITAGVSTLAYSTTSATNGGTISGTTLTLTAADASNPGLVSTGAQTIAGAKTFNNDITAPNFLGNATTATTAGNITATTNTTLTSLTNLNTVGTITTGTWSGTTIAVANGGTGATTAAGARTNLGLGSLSEKSTIANADVDASAAIAFSKLNITKANITGLGVQEGLTAGSGISISAGTISASGLTTSNLASNAAITNAQLAYSTTTLGSTTMTLGGTVTSVAGLNSVTSTGFTGTLTGNASTATKLAATKNINGIAFDGSADITIAADANTLTGTTLASNVVNSSLTSVGTITSGVWSGTTIAVAKGGTGATTRAAGFDALSPMTTSGDIIYGGASGTGTRLAKGTDGQVLTLASGIPSWAAISAVTSLGTFTTTAYAAGGTINGSTLTLSAADGTRPGLVSTVAQTFAGAKTFSSDINTNNDVRVGKGVAGNTSNTVIGKLALGGTSTVTNQNIFNTAIGISAMQNSDGTGSYNTAVGANSAFFNNSGSHNTYLGYQTGYYTTSGAKNVAIGSGALYGSTTGNYLTGAGNNAIGFEAMKDISTTAADNIAIGLSAGTKLTTGTKNIFIGSLAGSSISTGSTANTTGLNSVLIGYDVRPLANGDRNEVVISGYDGTSGTVGLGSNTTLIGSSTTTDARIMGALNLPNSTASTSVSTGALTVGGGTGIAGALNVGGATTITGAATISNTTASTSSTTGALVVRGGVGVAGALNIGGNTVIAGTIEIDGGSPGAGKVLTSDANGLASWTYGGGTTSTKTGAYTILLTDKYVFYGSTASAAATFTLPAATGNDGKEIIIKNKSAFILTIQRSGSETIFQENSTGNNAATSITLGIESSNNWVKLVSDGTQWVVFRALF